MHIGSGLNTVSSMYRQQKGNNMKTPASGEKTFYTAETPKVYQIFTTDNMSVSYTHLPEIIAERFGYDERSALAATDGILFSLGTRYDFTAD